MLSATVTGFSGCPLRAWRYGSGAPGFPRPTGFGHPGLCLSSPSGCPCYVIKRVICHAKLEPVRKVVDDARDAASRAKKPTACVALSAVNGFPPCVSSLVVSYLEFHRSLTAMPAAFAVMTAWRPLSTTPSPRATNLGGGSPFGWVGLISADDGKIAGHDDVCQRFCAVSSEIVSSP